MSAVIVAIITSIAAPLVGGAVWLIKTTYSDNRDSWRIRAESSEAREQELKSQLLPAVRDAVDGMNAIAKGQAENTQAYKEIAPVLERVEAVLKDFEERDEDGAA